MVILLLDVEIVSNHTGLLTPPSPPAISIDRRDGASQWEYGTAGKPPAEAKEEDREGYKTRLFIGHAWLVRQGVAASRG